MNEISVTLRGHLLNKQVLSTYCEPSLGVKRDVLSARKIVTLSCNCMKIMESQMDGKVNLNGGSERAS